MKSSDLHNSDQFQEILMLRHEEIVPFVMEQYDNRKAPIHFFIRFNILLGIVFLAWWVYILINTPYSFWTLLEYTGYGVILCFSVLIIIHEWIHGLAYKIFGAPKISYGGNLKKFYFFAAADQFVINENQLKIIALAPFVVISLFCLIALFFVNIPFSFMVISILLTHTTLCGGDFGMLNYLSLNDAYPLYTYDDIPKKTSWFFHKIK